MDVRTTDRPLVVMGVSGAGKTTVGGLIADRLGAPFIDADDLHGPDNIARMRAGVPLTDADRMPWLDRVGVVLSRRPAPVVACSALKRQYRDRLRTYDPFAMFLHLDGDAETIREFLGARTGHFMPQTLLDSQLAALEPLAADEAGMRLVIDAEPEALAVRAITALQL